MGTVDFKYLKGKSSNSKENEFQNDDKQKERKLMNFKPFYNWCPHITSTSRGKLFSIEEMI